MNFKELKKKIYTLKNQPNAIPYRTSYYKKDWGFCLSFNDYKKINKKQKFHVLINSKFFKGKLNYGEIFLKGKK